MDFANQYGTATLTPVGQVVDVGDVVGAEVIDAGLGFGVEDAEKLALISGNAKLQQAFNMERRKFYVMLHHSPRKVQVCRLDSLNCNEADPGKTLSSLNRGQVPIL